jgi:hypothetical protein
VLPHESNMSQKLLLETRKIGYSSLANRRVHFHWLQWQLGAPSALMRASFLRSCGVSVGENKVHDEPNELKCQL